MAVLMDTVSQHSFFSQYLMTLGWTSSKHFCCNIVEYASPAQIDISSSRTTFLIHHKDPYCSTYSSHIPLFDSIEPCCGQSNHCKDVVFFIRSPIDTHIERFDLVLTLSLYI